MLWIFLLVPICCYSLEGTWSSKSQTVLTGPGFYDPVDELLIEPALPGVCYSFDANGNWEQALYRVTSDPTNHLHATASLIWQHGKYTVKANNHLVLKPYEIDGRQLLSDPANDKGRSTYMRYHQEETFSNYIIEVDGYTGKLTLQLFKWDGTPEQPLYLVYKPPMMLPSQVLNPSTNQKLKRSIENRAKTTATPILGMDSHLFAIIIILIMLLLSYLLITKLARLANR